MPKKWIDVLVFMPVGPGCHYDFINDNIEAIQAHISQDNYAILLINDSGKSDLRENIKSNGDILIYDVSGKFSENPGYFGGLFIKQIEALRHATTQYDWRCGLRVDDDALIIGPNPQEDALARFSEDPRLGQLGAYHYRGDGTRKSREMKIKGRRLYKQALNGNSGKHLSSSWHFSLLILRALWNGLGDDYRLGNRCTGGSFFLSRAAFDGIDRLVQGHETEIADCRLIEDLLFSTYIVAAGYRIMDFSRPDVIDHVMAINYRHLPMSLEGLLAAGKKIVHPVKDVEDMKFQVEVREFFRSQRRDQM